MASGGRLILDTPRLRLRELDDADAPFILRLLNERGFLENIGDRGVRSLEDARRYIQSGPRASYARFGHGLWAVERREGGTPIGLCGLLRRDALEFADVGFATLEEFWSRGYTREAAAGCIDYAWRVLHLPRLLAIVSPGNARSLALLARLGFVAEGRIPWVAGGQTPPGEVELLSLRAPPALSDARPEAPA